MLRALRAAGAEDTPVRCCCDAVVVLSVCHMTDCVFVCLCAVLTDPPSMTKAAMKRLALNIRRAAAASLSWHAQRPVYAHFLHLYCLNIRTRPFPLLLCSACRPSAHYARHQVLRAQPAVAAPAEEAAGGRRGAAAGLVQTVRRAASVRWPVRPVRRRFGAAQTERVARHAGCTARVSCCGKGET